MDYFKAGFGVFFSKDIYVHLRTIVGFIWRMPRKRKINFRKFWTVYNGQKDRFVFCITSDGKIALFYLKYVNSYISLQDSCVDVAALLILKNTLSAELVKSFKDRLCICRLQW